MRILWSLVWLPLISVSCAAIDPNSARIGGPLTVDGPLVVHGPVVVGGPCTVHGPVRAAGLTVGGPVYTLPGGEKPGPAGQAFGSPLYIGGPLTVNGPLIADGKLTVGGPFTSEGMAGQDQVSLQAPVVVQQPIQVYQPQQPVPVGQLQQSLPSTLEVPPQQHQLYPISHPSETTE